MLRSETINELAKALAVAQGQILDAKKDSANPFFKSKYADLASVWEACRKPLSSNGLSVVQTMEVRDGKRILESALLHLSGQWISSTLDLVPKEETEQAIGSAITYTRRYALAALVGICPDDDDGEAAMARPAQGTGKQTDQAEHFCKEHNTKFFKTPKMKSFAHPIKDASGKDIGEWCHEHTDKQEPVVEKQGQPAEIEGIDVAWLKESLKTLKWNPLQWISDNQGLTGDKVLEVVSRMNVDQMIQFVAEITERLKMK